MDISISLKAATRIYVFGCLLAIIVLLASCTACDETKREFNRRFPEKGVLSPWRNNRASYSKGDVHVTFIYDSSWVKTGCVRYAVRERKDSVWFVGRMPYTPKQWSILEEGQGLLQASTPEHLLWAPTRNPE